MFSNRFGRKTKFSQRESTADQSIFGGIVEAIEFYRRNDRATIDVLSKFTGITDQRSVRDSYEFHKRLFPAAAISERRRIQNGARRNLAPKNVTPDTFFDRSLLQELAGK